MKIFGISYTRWERANFYQRTWRTKRKTVLQSFWTNSSILSNCTCFGFFQMEKIMLEPGGELTEQPFACSDPSRWNDIDENQTPSQHHGFEGGYQRWRRYITIYLSTYPHIQQRILHQVPGGGSAALDWEGGYWQILHLAIGLWTITHKQENPVLAVRKFLQQHHL